MGLAASQARLLLLTARKSDLEYRAQCITNTEMVLAMQTEAVSRKYAEAISNTALFYVASNNAAGTTQELLKMNNFASVTDAGYRIQILASHDENGKPIYEYYSPDKGDAYYKVNSDIYAPDDLNEDGTPKEGKTPIHEAGTKISIADWAKLKAEQKAQCSDKVEYNEYDNKYDSLSFIDALNNGTLRIVEAANGPDGEPVVVSLSGNNKFTESYYTDDDAQAEAEYKKETASIQVKEKRLQMELNQIEAQQKACDTEIDSVKKVMEKNVDRTFKVFS